MYNGQLLVSQPKNQDSYFSKSVILIAQHTTSGAWGVVLNRKARNIDMTAVMAAVGISHTGTEVVYFGGPVEPTRVHVVHTLDWSSSTTLKISDNIGITGDISVLAAIKQGQGPEFCRVGVGLAVWTAGQLDGEQSGVAPWSHAHRWLTTPATMITCFIGTGDTQWQSAIDASVNRRITELF
jgi:putative transcriptional regulator